MHKIYKSLLIILFFTLPLIHSYFFNTIGIHIGWYVDGNFEFTKSIFFNILSGLIITTYIIHTLVNNISIKIPKFVIPLICVIIIVTVNSLSPFQSFLGGDTKGHGAITLLHLVGVFIIFFNLDNKTKTTLIKTTIYSAIIACIFGLKEYISPTFDYRDLSNRVVGTFGHPNYLALYILVITPLVFRYISGGSKYAIGALFGITLLFTKSVWGILIALGYSLYLINTKIRYKHSGYIIIGILGILSIGILYKFGLTTKLHSFLSRYYIWESTLSIIISDLKYLLIGGGFETLGLIFDNFKSEYLYIFENIGFTADRPHNLLLNIFYSTGIFGVISAGYIAYHVIKKSENNYFFHALILFGIFTLFNFASISVFLILILISTYILNSENTGVYSLKNKVLLSGIILFTFIQTLLVIGFYASEVNYKKGEYSSAKRLFPTPKVLYKLGELTSGQALEKYNSERYYITQIIHNPDLKTSCDELIQNYPTVENYFYCGEQLEKSGDKLLAFNYYKKGVDILPDLWDTNSKYYDNIFVKNTIDGVRFFHPKYSKLQEILVKIK